MSVKNVDVPAITTPTPAPDIDPAPTTTGAQSPAQTTPTPEPATVQQTDTDGFSSTASGPVTTETRSNTDPVTGARGSGRPTGPTGPLGTQPPLAVSRFVAKSIDTETFMAANRDNPIASRPIIANAEHFAPAPGQGWVDLARQVYGAELAEGVSDETLALLGEALAQINGRSNLEAPPAMVAVPDLRDVNRVLTGMKRGLQSGPPTVRASVALFGGDQPTPRNLPTAGHTYEARWNDSLRGVVLHAYGDELRGLNPAQADAKLQEMMLVVARLNDLNTTDLRDAGVIWMPGPRQIRHAMLRLSHPRRRQKVLGDNAALWRSVQRTGRDAVTDLAFNEDRQIIPATARGDLAATIEQTDADVLMARFERVLDAPLGFNTWGMFSWNWLFEFYTEDPPVGDELPIRREYESFEEYLDRVAPDMPPEEYRRVLDNPGAFMMRAAGLINANGDADEQKQQQFASAMLELGMVDDAGRWIVPDPQPEESAQEYANRVSLEAARRVGIEFEVLEGDTLETIFNRIEATATPQQKALARQLVIWNQLVVLGAVPGAGDGSKAMLGPDAPPPGMEDLFGDDLLDLFLYGGYMPPPVDIEDYKMSDKEILLEGWEDPGVADDIEYFSMLDGEDSEISDELDADIARVAKKAKAQQEDAARSQPSNEEVIAARREARSTDKVIERDRAHVKEVVTERTDEAVEVKQTLDRGEQVGGAGRRRRGT